MKLLGAMAIILILVQTYRNYRSYDEIKTQHETYLQAKNSSVNKDSLTIEQKKTLKEWEEKIKKPDSLERKRLRDSRKVGYWKAVQNYSSIAQRSQSSFVHQLLFLETLSMMLLGILLFKIGYFSSSFPVKYLWIIAFAGYTIGLLVVLPLESSLYQSGYSLVEIRRYQTLYQFERLPLTLAHMSLIMLLLRLPFAKWIGNTIAAAGRMAFSNYLLQSIICIALFYDFGVFGSGFGLYSKLQIHELFTVVAIIWIVQICWSVIWMRFFQIGPFEWLWRSLTFWRLQPFRTKVAVSSQRKISVEEDELNLK